MAIRHGLAVERKRKRKTGVVAKLIIPPEILMEIISKLPISTILQLSHKFTEFKPLIFDPHFNKIFQSYHHISCSTTKPPCTLLGFYSNNNEACLIEYRPNNNKTVRTYHVDMSFLDANDDQSISTREWTWSACNGWLLERSIHKFDDGDVSSDNVCGCLFESLRIVNPATRDCLIFHREPVVDQQEFYTEYVLGYSSKTGKYKALRIVRSLFSEFSFQVFDILGDDKRWKKLNFDYEGHQPTSPVVLNGAVHWLSSKNTILRFDIDKEEFEFIPTPYTYNSDDGQDDIETMSTTFIATSCGLLYLGAYDVMDFIRGLEIWVMKEYGVKDSWVRVAVIQSGFYDPYNGLELFQVLDNGKMLFISNHHLQGKKWNLELYDIETGVREALVMRGIPSGKRRRMRLLPYVPSFLSLDGSA